MKSFRVAVCQTMLTSERAKSRERARAMIGEAAANRAGVVVLGEMFNCPYQNQAFRQFAEQVPGGETYEMLSGSARENQVYVIGGSLPERAGAELYNTCCIFDPQGRLIARHRKMHLFDVELPTLRFKESETLSPGREITLFDTPYGRMGTAICYDIRFPELMRLMALGGAEILIVPAAFNLTTGPAHWELLFRTRALDNQVYMIGASPARDVAGAYVAYGHSIITSPWGDVLARAGAGEEIIYADLDADALTKIRAELPLLKHRRADLYEVTRKLG